MKNEVNVLYEYNSHNQSRINQHVSINLNSIFAVLYSLLNAE